MDHYRCKNADFWKGRRYFRRLFLAKPLFFLLFCLLSFISVFSQEQPKADSLAVQKDTSQRVEKIDAFDVAAEILQKIGARKGKSKEFLHEDNDTVLKNIFSVLPLVQYTPATKWEAGGVLNMAFFTGHALTTNLSAIHSEVAYTMNHQFILISRSVIWSKGNKYNFVGDWRYDKYPSYTYGLGAHSSIEDKTLLDFSYVRFYQTVYRRVYPALFLGLGYNLDYRFNLQQVDERTDTDFSKYNGNMNKTVSSGPTFNLLYDSRKNPNNPVKGAHYANVIYRRNLKAFGSTANWQAVIMDVRKYIALPAKSSHILAFWMYNWITFNGNTPYLDLPASYWDSYENQGRGYIQGRFRSRGLVSMEVEYRFSITRNKLFGGVLFSNVQSVSNWDNYTFDTYYPAVGAGLRIKLNKFTNTNLAIDYAVGVQGSNGIFFNLGEVF